jgi:toxin ParE1/3/4
MDFKVFLSREALNDLERITAYIALHNPGAAERMGYQLLDTALSLDTLPERGRKVPEFPTGEFREIIYRSYRIIYRVQKADSSVEIVRFWHGARGFPRISEIGPEL